MTRIYLTNERVTTLLHLSFPVCFFLDCHYVNSQMLYWLTRQQNSLRDKSLRKILTLILWCINLQPTVWFLCTTAPWFRITQKDGITNYLYIQFL